MRKVCFDKQLKIEAYHFKGIMQKFPNHFHEHYVIGFIENGKRHLICENKEYITCTNDLVLFNPNDIHTCEQVDNRPLDFRCINIMPENMKKITKEITGESYLPYFTKHVLPQSEFVLSLKELHTMVMKNEKEFKKEELLFLLVGQLIAECSSSDFLETPPQPSAEIKTICDYLEKNYADMITLEQLGSLTGLSKYYLVRSFTKQKGISPYCYLETIRINQAKKLLEKGVSPMETALQTGFTDQSHFTNFFKRFIGLTPKQYMKIFMEVEKDDK